MSPFPEAPPARIEDAESLALLRDPAVFLRGVGALSALRPGVALALVHRPATDQRLLSVAWFAWPHGTVTDAQRQERSRLLSTAAESLWGSDRSGRRVPEHSFVLVTCRSGRAQYGPFEADVAYAWRYANHLLPAFSGDLLVVTPSGWTSIDDQSCGAWPALTSDELDG